MPVGTIDTNPPTIIEGQTKRFRITMDPVPTAPLIAEVRVSQVGDFITGSPGAGIHTVHFSANQATATITVNTENDQVDEPNGEISAELLKRTGYDVGDPSIATVIVEDNDGGSPPPPPTPSVTISAGTSSITEGTDATIHTHSVPCSNDLNKRERKRHSKRQFHQWLTWHAISHHQRQPDHRHIHNQYRQMAR